MYQARHQDHQQGVPQLIDHQCTDQQRTIGPDKPAPEAPFASPRQPPGQQQQDHTKGTSQPGQQRIDIRAGDPKMPQILPPINVQIDRQTRGDGYPLPETKQASWPAPAQHKGNAQLLRQHMQDGKAGKEHKQQLIAQRLRTIPSDQTDQQKRQQCRQKLPTVMPQVGAIRQRQCAGDDMRQAEQQRPQCPVIGVVRQQVVQQCSLQHQRIERDDGKRKRDNRIERQQPAPINVMERQIGLHGRPA